MNEREAVFKDKVNEIAQVYREDTFRYLIIVFPRVHNKTQELEQSMNMVWDEGKDPKTFREAVKEWQDIQMKFIKLFHDKNGIATVIGKIYNSSNGKPGPSQGLGKEAKDNGTL